MSKPYYQKVISLSEVDHDKLKALNDKGVKNIEVFRAGMELYRKKLSRSTT
jgi:hypothetical protein